MSAGRYPLTALEGLRRRLVEGARGELAAAVADAARATRAVEEAQRALEDAGARRRSAERVLERGSAAELAARGRWIARLRGEEGARGQEASRRREEALSASAREDRQRATLAEAERALRTVERHRELWEADRRRMLTIAEEAEQDDRRIAVDQRST